MAMTSAIDHAQSNDAAASMATATAMIVLPGWGYRTIVVGGCDLSVPG